MRNRRLTVLEWLAAAGAPMARACEGLVDSLRYSWCPDCRCDHGADFDMVEGLKQVWQVINELAVRVSVQIPNLIACDLLNAMQAQAVGGVQIRLGNGN